jgi:hypothetical protein
MQQRARFCWPLVAAAPVALSLLCEAHAATMFSVRDSYKGAGTFHGPGKIPDSVLFDAQINGIGFSAPLNFVTPFANNGGDPPNLCGETELGKAPTGLLSDGVTRINENVDACAFMLNTSKVLVAIIDGGPHEGQQVAVTTGVAGEVTMTMTMDFAIDLGIGAAGVIKLQFFGTTGEVTVPTSLQTALGIPGGIDVAGSLKPGEKLRGRLGDFNKDGMLDGAIVVAGNLPLTSIFMPGAPYALIRYFDTDVPYDGVVVGAVPASTNGAPKKRSFGKAR